MSQKRNRLTAIVLAAGKGTRMNSPLPKVLHPLAGQPMIVRCLKALKEVPCDEIRVIAGYQYSLIQQVVEPLGAKVFLQNQQNGTADAVKCADLSSIEGDVLIVNADHPLISGQDLKRNLQQYYDQNLDLAVLSCQLPQPGSFGRIVRNHGKLFSIVEAKDGSKETLAIKEVNTGIYIVEADLLRQTLDRVRNNNAQNEYYLTDIVGFSVEAGANVDALLNPRTVAFGVNTQAELARASRYVFSQNAQRAMDNGAIVMDAKNVYIESEVRVGQGVVLHPGVHLQGQTSIGSSSVVEPGCVIQDSEIAEHVVIKAYSHLQKVKVARDASVGPFARLRPETAVGVGAHIGNFVEMKNVDFGNHSKAGHLTYLGDAKIGEDVNVGCGTITCNYAVDRKKYQTTIGKGVFVGSDVQFVAPVTVGDNAVIASGSTITKDVPASALGVARSRQFNKENYSKVKKDS